MTGALPFGLGAQAQEPLRYTITPTTEGFVRLDTLTGTVTHCSQADAAWRCDPPLYSESEIDARLRALNEKIDGLGAQLAALADKVPASPVVAEPAPLPGEVVAELPVEPPPAAESPAADAPNFFERALDRLFRLVGGMKGEIAQN